MSAPLWIVMVVAAQPELTRAAIADCLAQTIPVRLLVVNQAVDDAFRTELERIAEDHADRVFVWSHEPPLTSLSATWNRALQMVWEAGGTEALVVNNDVRLHRRTLEQLDAVIGHTPALFVTAIGVTREQFEAYDGEDQAWFTPPDAEGWGHPNAPGGPDFACFLISREAHARYPFDEGFLPAYCEDVDLHRRYLLAGDGDQIFSVNLPFWHVGGGSNTLKSLAPEQRAARERLIGQGRAYYERKWGGPVNQERYVVPFDAGSAQAGATTPELQRAAEHRRLALPVEEGETHVQE